MTNTYTEEISTPTDQTGAPIRISNISKSYGDLVVLDNVSFDIRAGEFITLLGASGSGKSTLLNILAGFTAPDQGRVEVDGIDITRMPPHKRGLGMVFQHYALFPHMTVFENIAFGLRRKGVPKPQVIERVGAVLELVQMSHLASRKPSQLSGGQQQRVALARGIVFKPRVLLMDEPLGALDKLLREELQLEIRNIHHELGITFIFVTHDQNEALTMSDRIALLRHGQIVQLDSPQVLYEAPTSRYAAEFIGASNLFNGRVDGNVFVHEDGGERLSVPVGSGSMLMVRPEHVQVEPRHDSVVGSGRDRIEAAVEDCVYVGTDMVVHAKTSGGKRVIARADVASGTRGIQAGAEVFCSWNVENARLIEED